jgi:hypothetical protein
MNNAVDIFGTVFKNGSTVILARIVDAEGTPIQQADLSSISYSVYLLDEVDPDTMTVATGHDGETLTIADVVYDTLQTDAIWDVDSTGYNFKHTLDVSTNQAFTVAGRDYQIRYELTPTTGQVVIARCRVAAI